MDTKEINSFDILIKFIEASKTNKDIETHFNGKTYSISPNKNYLLSQILRQYSPPNPLTYEKIAEILDNIYACIMLKEEDRNIKYRSKREYDVIRVVENDYRNTKDNIPIEIDNWDSIKKSIEKKR